jgi:dihydroorotase (multifunctional complex type)
MSSPSDRPLLIRGARLFDGTRFHDDCDLVAGVDGRIQAVGPGLDAPADAETVDARGRTLLPGLVDCHVHFREPGLERKEGYATGSAGALHGGVTTVCEIQNNPPLMESGERLQAKLDALRGVSRVDYAPYGSLTMDALPQVDSLRGLCPAVKCFLGCSTGAGGVKSEAEMRALFDAAARADLLVVAHCEDNAIMDRAAAEVTSGQAARHDLLRPRESEVQSIRDALRVAKEVGTRLHVFHVSTAEGARLVAEAAAAGQDVGLSTGPHYLLVIADEAHAAPQNRFKVNPSIKYEEDRDDLARMLGDGRVRIVGTDHAPHPLDEKARPYAKAPSGFPSIDLLLPLMFSVVDMHGIPEEAVLAAVTRAPADEFGLTTKGRLEPGADADLVLVDSGATHIVDEVMLPSKSKWSPYHGRMLRGFPDTVWLRGRPVWRHGMTVGEPRGVPLFPARS